MTQEHIPGPCPHCGHATARKLVDHETLLLPGTYDRSINLAVVCCANSGGCGAMGGFGQSIEDAIAKWNRRPDPEYIPSKPGGEAAAPVPLNGLADFVLRDTDGRHPTEIYSCTVAFIRGMADELSSLRESVASLTRERNEALIALGKAAFEIKALEADRG